MTPEKLQAHIFDLLQTIANGGKLGVAEGLASITLNDIVVERPRDRAHGDWASNVAMKFWKQFNFSNPREFANEITERLSAIEDVSNVEIAGPGFINITLSSASQASIVLQILNEGQSFGVNHDILKGEVINLEFVSANPTGPLHIGGVRWAAVGDALARILRATGAIVECEYYFNDHGVQIDHFKESLAAAAHGQPTPENGYAGQYIQEIAAEIVARIGENATLEDFRREGVAMMFPAIKQSLEDFGVHFDTFFHEQDLYDDGKVQATIMRLRDQGDVYEKDGATWVATSKYGDDKDRVVIKSDGNEAYFAADIAYYLDKRSRADKAIYMLGADHGGYVGRLEAIARAFGDKPHINIEVMIGQMVNLLKGGEPFKMSKRAGTIVTLEDLVEIVGVDAARYSLVRSSTDTTIELDLDLLASHTNDNPVYYVQYAYARTRNVTRNVEAVSPSSISDNDPDLSLLTDPTENDLLATLANYPSVVAHAAKALEPHRIARYLEDLAAAYHKWYAAVRVVGNNVPESLTLARATLNNATSQVLKNGLTLLGVSAPEKM